VNFKDIKATDEPGDLGISLTKLTGKKIKDIVGHLTKEFGDPTFQLSMIVLEDGSVIHCEGEHDMPYLTGIPGVSDEDLESLNNEAHKAFNEHYGIKDEETE
jgi:hypothetical protein